MVHEQCPADRDDLSLPHGLGHGQHLGDVVMIIWSKFTGKIWEVENPL